MSNKHLIILFFLFTSLLSVSQDLHFEWGREYGSDNSSNELKSLASDNNNHVFVFTNFDSEYAIDGVTFSTQGEKDLILYSINEDGNVEWYSQQGGPDSEYAQEVACDKDGNVYIIGKFHQTMLMNGETYYSNGTFDMYLAKFSNTGDFFWCKTFGGPNTESLVSLELKYNRVIVAGRYYDYTVIDNDTLFSQSGTDVFVAKFDLDGHVLQTATFGGQSVDMVSDMDIDGEGNIYLTGDFYGDIIFNDEYSFNVGDLLGVYIVKLSPSLNVEWAYQIEGDDLKPGVKLGVSSDGVCSVSGVFSSNVTIGDFQFSSQEGAEEIYMLSMGSQMQINWAKHYYATSMANIMDLESDREGGIYLTGHYIGSVYFDDLTLNYSLC